MRGQLATGQRQADLTLNYDHHIGGIENGFKFKDFQVISAEIVGTFYLCFVVSMTATNPLSFGAPYAIGLALMSAVYMTGPVSGGQVNPAIATALIVRNKLNLVEAAYCIASQLIGAFVAGTLAYGLYNDDWSSLGYPHSTNGNRRGQAFLAETVQTFALATTVLNTATTKIQANNSYFGIAIGFVVLSGALNIGSISGASFNPAVSMLTVLQQDWDSLWPIIIGPFVGAIIAGLVFRVTNPAEWDDTDPVARLTMAHHNPEGNLTRLAAMLCQEFIGSFFWSWTYALQINAGEFGGIFAVGCMITSMSYAGGAVSGAHYNPAVTLGVYLRGLFEEVPLMRAIDVLQYCAVQIAGAFAGASLAGFVNAGTFGNNIHYPSIDTSEYTIWATVACEFVFTYGFIMMVLSCGTAPKVLGNSYFGIAIGFYHIAAQIAGAGISKSVMNPAIGKWFS